MIPAVLVVLAWAGAERPVAAVPGPRAAVTAGAVPAVATVAFQEETRIAGRVVDASTRAPVAGAWVRLVGTGLGAVTGEAGHFVITGVAPGRYRLRAERIGYAPSAEDLEVPPAGVSGLEIALRIAPVELGAIVAAAAKREQTLAEAPVSVSVLDARELERTTPLTVRDAVEYVPAVQFVGDQINVRGSSGYSRGTGARVLFLIDGVPANASDAGNINWDIVPVAEVERVEVIKGPGSALWGSSALGGVVNVLLSDAPGRHVTRFRLLGGFYDSPPHPEWEWTGRTLGFGSFEVLHGGPVGPVSGWLRYGRARSDGYRESSFSSRTNVSGRGRLLLGRADTLRAFAAFARERYGSPLLWCLRGQCRDAHGLAYQPLRVDSTAVRDFTRSEKTFASLQWRRSLGSRFTSRARVSLLINNWTSRFGESTEGAVSDRLGGEWQVDARHGDRGGSGGVATVGTEWA
ncbi:MAG: TonB-dependent receptor, partial [Gemmatimonadetes bacterium]|nr:TonB-dependent receptor [Gemmatimonadota bacterium]